MSDSDTISPTAHYTGQVWLRHGLSHPRLGTPEGRVLYDALHPLMVVSGLVGGPSLEAYLLARHRAIDALVKRAIEEHGVSQVVEVAAGLSPRGWRFSQRYGDRITYIEADLPDMADRKRRALAQMLSLDDHHRVVDLDARRDAGPGSLADLAATLDHGQGLAIITEGLLGYLDPDSVDGLWHRFARTLHEFSTGRYISDLHLGSVQDLAVRGFRVVLSAFVRGRVYLHFDDAAQAEAALRQSGFDEATVRSAYAVLSDDGKSPEPGAADRGTRLAHILEASTR